MGLNLLTVPLTRPYQNRTSFKKIKMIRLGVSHKQKWGHFSHKQSNLNPVFKLTIIEIRG